MKFCPQCNSEYKDSIYFCLKDGAILKYYYDSPYSESSNLSQTKSNFQNSSENTITSLSEETFVHITSDTVFPSSSEKTDNQEKNNTESDNLNSTKFSKQNVLLISALLLFGSLIIIGAVFFGYKYLNPMGDLVLSNNNQQGNFSNTLSLTNNETNSTSNPNNNNNNSFGENSNFNGLEINANLSPTANSAKSSGNNLPTPKNSPTRGKRETPTPTPEITPELPPKTPAVIKTPTPVWQPPTPKPTPTVVSGGVVNGRAINLVKPPFPPIAKRMGIYGQVSVKVMIDENGNVISATALNGNNLLRGPAENAARLSKFSPTYLSGERVKVSGLIIYNFTQSN